MHLEGTPQPGDGQLLCGEDGVSKGAALPAPVPAVQGEPVPDSAPAAKHGLEIWAEVSVLQTLGWLNSSRSYISKICCSSSP